MAHGSSNPTTDIKKIAGTAISVGAGNTDTGTQRVVLSTNQSSIPVTDGGGSLTVDGSVTVSGTVTANTGLSQPLTDAQLRAAAVPVSIASVPSHPVTNAGTFAVQVTSAPTTAVTGTFWQATQPVQLTTLPALPTGSNTIGTVNIGTVPTISVNTHAVTQSGTWNIGSITTLPTVTIATNSSVNVQLMGGAVTAMGAGTSQTGTQRVIEASSSTATQTNPSLSTTSATVLAANTTRRGAQIFNGSTSIVYVRLSATAASATVYSIKLQPDDYYEVPGFYNGAITGILNTGTSTLVQVTEIT